MRKSIALLLAVATLVLALAACADTPTDGTDQTTDAAAESEETLYLDNIPEDLKFDGEDIVILNRALAGWTWDEIAVPELNSEPVNDAMFNRNVAVADRLNLNIVSSPIEDPNENLPIETIKRVVKGGSDEYDLVAAAVYVTTPAALDGTFYDLTKLEYLDLDQGYWMQEYNQAMSYAGSQHTATGVIALSTYRFAFVTMFNKLEFDNKSVPYLYEAVANNEWTLDYQARLAKDFYRDTNGNNKKDEGDFFGFASCSGINTDAYWASCDIPIVEKDPDGNYQYVLDVGYFSDVMDKVLYLFYDCGGTYLFPVMTNNVEQDELRIMFSKGETAMMTIRLVAVEQPDIRNMETEYGIVPVPKYSEEQKTGGTMIHDQFTVFAVPVSAAKHKLEMIGAAMEVMASESQKLVKPAYYEIALKRKYMSDPVAWDMLDIIFSDIHIDPAVTYVVPMGCPHQKMRSIVAGKKNTVSSQCANLGKSVDKCISRMQKKLEKLADS